MGLFVGDLYSNKLRMTTQIKVIFPEPSNDVTPIVDGEPKVLYLLHGLSGNSGEWTRFSKIEYYAKKYNLIIIMPEVQRSFYTCGVNQMDYLGYVADELPKFCKTWFHIPTGKENTFIAGESMGGYGAVKIALNRVGQYDAVASLSGVLDYCQFAKDVLDGNWDDMRPEEIQCLHGQQGVPKELDDPLALVRKYGNHPDRPRLLQMCGTEDFLYQANQVFRQVAMEAGYGHEYQEGPGDHEWPYWDKAIQKAIWFFLKLSPDEMVIY
nr:Lip061 [uncultured bacterium]